MKLLLCHNYYQQRGGEDQSFEDEAALLESYGHDVLRYTPYNDDIKQMSGWDIAQRTLWNRQTYREVRELIRRERPAIMHCTNTFPLMSPSAYYAARAEGVKVVQSLRNYRLLCPAGSFLRDGKVCEDCMHKLVTWPAVRHACYRDNRAASAVATAMLGLHWAGQTWTRAVDLYYTLTNFGREKFIAGGLPAEKIVIKQNFVFLNPPPGTGSGGYAVFCGRLSTEKGLETLFSAWSRLSRPLPLKIVGDGPGAARVRDAAAANPHVEWLGRRPLEELLQIVGDASFLVLPSIWYEGLPRIIVESYGCGTPVLASRLGAMIELIDDGRTGAHFEAGNADDLAAKVQRLVNQPELLPPMRQAARAEYERVYTPHTNYERLMEIYEQVLTGKSSEALTVAM